MATAKHTPPGDDSFRDSLLRAGAGAVGLVALVALVFAGIGALGPGDEPPTVAGDAGAGDGGEDPEEDVPAEGEEPDDPAPPGRADDAGEPDEPPEPAEEDADADADGEAEPDDEQQPADTDAQADADAEVEDEAEDEAEGRDEADSEPDGDREFAPDSVTVQVLDGYQEDGGSAAASVGAALREEGYRVVAENPSLRYEVTTVMWTAGFEAQARQVAADIGAPEVRQQPGNLSEQVQVHVVVGADRG